MRVQWLLAAPETCGNCLLWQLDYLEPPFVSLPTQRWGVRVEALAGPVETFNWSSFQRRDSKEWDHQDQAALFFVADKASFPLLWILTLTVIITKSLGGRKLHLLRQGSLNVLCIISLITLICAASSSHISSLFLTFNFYFLSVYPLICRNKRPMIL